MALDTYEDGGKARRKDADQTQLNDSQSKTEHDKHLSLNIRDSKHTVSTILLCLLCFSFETLLHMSRFHNGAVWRRWAQSGAWIKTWHVISAIEVFCIYYHSSPNSDTQYFPEVYPQLSESIEVSFIKVQHASLIVHRSLQMASGLKSLRL